MVMSHGKHGGKTCFPGAPNSWSSPLTEGCSTSCLYQVSSTGQPFGGSGGGGGSSSSRRRRGRRRRRRRRRRRGRKWRTI